jgi:ABC-type cobalamin/Fe3+-siderophores transport system ATPase subunit
MPQPPQRTGVERPGAPGRDGRGQREAQTSARPGDIVGLIGPNGSDKSTLLRTVYRSLRPQHGVVRVDGDDVWALSPRTAARRTAAVLQDASGSPTGLSVTEIVALGRSFMSRQCRDSFCAPRR